MQWISVKDDLTKKAGIYWVAYEIHGILKSHYCLYLSALQTHYEFEEKLNNQSAEYNLGILFAS